MRFEGWHVKNMALKGGASQNSRACKKGGQPKNSFKFCRDGICNYENILPDCQIWSKQISNRGYCFVVYHAFAHHHDHHIYQPQ